MSNAGLLTIEIDNLGGISPSQASIFDEAILVWGSLLTGIQSSFDLTLNIEAQGTPIDGVNGILASASPTYAVVDTVLGFAYAYEGIMTFDSADLDALELTDNLFDTVFHEMAHVLGFGTLWNTDSRGGIFTGTQNVYVPGSGQYTGLFALEQYRKEFDASASFVPVELDGGEGTANAHWDEQWGGGSSDVLTGYLEGTTTLSRTSIASFADIGYTTIFTHPVAVPEPAQIGLLSLGLLLIYRRRQQ
ncbi:MAG: hypothetical protein ACJA13_002078 [Paraglaciecola sp.]|jgi:hypothetical protein